MDKVRQASGSTTATVPVDAFYDKNDTGCAEGCKCHELRTQLKECHKCKTSKWRCLRPLLKYHRSIGLSHILFFIMLCGYTFGGAAVFWWIEIDNEKQIVVDNEAAIKNLIDNAADKMSALAVSTDDTLEDELKDLYVSVLKVDGKYLWSTFDKLERNGDGSIAWAWTYAAALYFSITLWTTVGYGALNPVTYCGKIATIVFGTCFIPHGLSAVRDLSVAALNGCTRVYARMIFKIREVRGIAVSEKEEVSMNTFQFAFLVACYIFFCGFLVCRLDANGAYWAGLSMYDSFYYAFVSVAAIGMGDIVPNNITFAPITVGVFFFGMPLMRIVNRNYYLGLENAVNGTAEAIHIMLDKALGLTPPDDSPAVVDVRRRSDKKSTVSSPDDLSAYSSEDEDERERRVRAEMMNNFSIHSIASFMKSKNDVFNGEYGRVTLRKSDL